MLKSFGGKHYLADQINQLRPPSDDYDHYVETHFATGAVLFAADPDLYLEKSEIINDIDGDVVNFWRTLQDEKAFAEFKRLAEAAPVSEALWKYSRVVRPILAVPDARLAFQFFVGCRQSREGKMQAFTTLTKSRTRRGMNEQVSAWLTAVDGLPEVHTRLKRVLILEAQDACPVIKRQDTPRTLFYCDPPYFHATRVSKAVYRFEMTGEQHVGLLNTLTGIKGKFILSGYQSDLYDNWARKNGFFRYEIKIDCKASAKKEKPQRVECLYMNYEPPVDTK
jgi:DNA adenine methylase